jgi:quercetin dioxygenase-like cupin family protein
VNVLSGSVYNAMNNEPVTLKKAGDSFFEAPGCWHRVSGNASDTEDASIFVAFVIETEVLENIWAESGVHGLVVIDEEYREVVMEQMKKL